MELLGQVLENNVDVELGASDTRAMMKRASVASGMMPSNDSRVDDIRLQPETTQMMKRLSSIAQENYFANGTSVDFDVNKNESAFVVLQERRQSVIEVRPGLSTTMLYDALFFRQYYATLLMFEEQIEKMLK